MASLKEGGAASSGDLCQQPAESKSQPLPHTHTHTLTLTLTPTQARAQSQKAKPSLQGLCGARGHLRAGRAGPGRLPGEGLSGPTPWECDTLTARSTRRQGRNTGTGISRAAFFVGSILKNNLYVCYLLTKQIWSENLVSMNYPKHEWHKPLSQAEHHPTILSKSTLWSLCKKKGTALSLSSTFLTSHIWTVAANSSCHMRPEHRIWIWFPRKYTCTILYGNVFKSSKEYSYST